MKNQGYTFKNKEDLFHYEFLSVGLQGTIRKVVEFQKTNNENVYNLALGDLKQRGQSLDDNTISHNGDTGKVLRTIASIIFEFTLQKPDVWIFAQGNSKVKNRLYQMSLSNNLSIILKSFELFGLKENRWEHFSIGRNYDAFLAKRK